MSDESDVDTKLLKEFEDRLHKVERWATDNKTSLTDLKKKVESHGKQFESKHQLKTTLELAIRKIEKLEDVVDSIERDKRNADNLDLLLIKMDHQQQLFQDHVENYKKLKKELLARFGTQGGI